MTTIAYKDGVVAFDSRVTRGSLIDDDDCDKCITVNGVHFILAGAESVFPKIIEGYFGVEVSAYNGEATGFVVDGGNLWLVGIESEGGFWKNSVDLSKALSVGSGRDHATTAMDCGKTAREAVQFAIKRDVYTGGAVRVRNVPR